MIEKIAKICWNDFDWTMPSGSNGKSFSSNSYEKEHGFGHEEWLFDKSKVVDGYHYAFLQPLNLKTAKHVGNIYRIWLYTLRDKKKFLVGYIDNAVCISEEESANIYEFYKKNGWLKEMNIQLQQAGIAPRWKKFTEPKIFCNVKFKISHIHRRDELTEIKDEDKNITTTRYKLLNKTSDFELATPSDKYKGPYYRKNINAAIIDPYHRKMQDTLIRILKAQKEYNLVQRECFGVDVRAVSKSGQVTFFEIKTNTPKNNTRQALGQLLEYCYYPTSNKANKLIVIGDEMPSKNTVLYLSHLRKQTDLPIYYRWLDMEKILLSEEI